MSGVRRHVIVIGGGLSGATAAVRLADSGAAVTLLEARPRLGGVATSFIRDGLTIDTGQHVFLRSYTAYRALLERLGVGDLVAVQDRFAIPVVTPEGRGARLSSVRLPAPWHVLPSLARYRPLGVGERLQVARAARALARVDPDDAEADTASFGDWLLTHGQSRRTIERFWRMLTVAALNAEPEDASLALAAKVLRTGVLEDRHAPDIGVPLVPLGELHDAAVAETLREAGADVRVRTRVTSLVPTDTGFRVSTAAGRPLTADAVVLAVPHATASALLPAVARPARRWDGLGSAPMVNVHVIYPGRVTRLRFAAVLDSPAQWVFDRTMAAGLAKGQYLVIPLSAAHPYVDLPVASLRQVFVPALARLFPRAAEQPPRDFFVTRERRATFAQAPGTRALRPGSETALPGLLLAGAWTATGWPDTMEGAVRSGEQAAALAAAHLSRQSTRTEVNA